MVVKQEGLYHYYENDILKNTGFKDKEIGD